jgi:hypothetical protein
MLSAILAAAGLLAAPARADAQSGGVKAGINVSRLEVVETPVAERQYQSGFVAGGFVTFGDSRVSGQVEGLYSIWRTRLNVATTQTLRLTWFEVPVLVRIDAVRRADRYANFHVVAGPSFALKLGAEVEENSALALDDNLEAYDVGLLLGAGFDVGHLVVDGRYTIGLRDLDKSLGSGAIKNRTFTLLAGIRFP